MKMSSDSLVRWIDFALEMRPPPRVVIRGGEEAPDVDFFSVTFQIDSGDYKLESRKESTIHCLRYEDGVYQVPTTFSVYDVWAAKKTAIFQFYREHTIRWDSWDSFAFEQRTKWIYAKLAAQKAWEFVRYAYRSRLKVVTAERMKVLSVIFSEQLRTELEKVPYLLIYQLVYGPNYFSHPGIGFERARLQAILKGLVETGELDQTDSVLFSVNGKGIAAIELFEEQERKHRDAMTLHKRMFWLTLVLTISAIVQAGIVRPPPMWKFERWFWQEPSKPEVPRIDECACPPAQGAGTGTVPNN